MATEVKLPRLGQGMESGTIVKWLKGEGEPVKKTNRAVVAHEAVTRMGFGAEVAAIVQEKAFDWLDAPVERVGAKFAPLPFAPVMEEFVVPHKADVLEAIRRTVARG